MKTLSIYLSILFLVLSSSTISFGQKRRKEKSVELKTIFTEVTKVLSDLDNSQDVPVAKKVTITFETENTLEGGAGLKIQVFKIGGKRSKANSNEVSYVFDLEQKETFKKGDITDKLAIAIANAYKNINTLEGPARDQLSELTVKVSFTIEWTIDGELEIVPITASGSYKRKAVHSIEVEFGKKTTSEKSKE